MAGYMRNRHEERRKWAIELLGGVCVGCGVAEALEFHHIVPATKDYDISTNLSKLTLERLQIELEKCELRCEKCHKVEHKWKHGTLAGYRYCKCFLCKKVRNEYSREWKRRKRLGLS